MGVRQMIKQIQHDSGFSDSEAKEALELTVEAVAERLNEGEREDFASQLPLELQDIALNVESTKQERAEDIIHEFMEKEGIEEARAKKQLLSAWKTIRNMISEGEVRHIKSQLNKRTSKLLF